MFELVCLILSMLVYVMYISIVCFKYGVPDCISRSYYLFKDGNVFTYWIITVAFLLFPAWVGISGVSYLFVTFLSVVFLCAVGTVPKYLESLRVLHIIFAGVALVLSVIWTMVSSIYIVPAVLLGLAITLSLIFRGKSIFIIENLAFANIYLSVLIKILLLL